MRNIVSCAAALGFAAFACGQAAPSPSPSTDQVLTGIRTPSLLSTGQTWLDLSFHAFGGDDKFLYTNAWLAYGIAKNWQIDLRGDFAADGTFFSPSGDNIRFGGSDGELMGKYKLPTQIPISLQAGLAYVATPAQDHKLATVFGGSISYPFGSYLSLYAEPKAVILDRNSLVGLGLGASGQLSRGIELYGEWTPMLAGDNTIDANSGNRSRVQLFGGGLRFRDLWQGFTLDLGMTNETGFTTGTSLTPDLGNAAGFYVGGAYRF